MKFTVTQELFELFPTLKVGVLLVRNVDNTKNTDSAYQYLCNEVDAARIKYNKTPVTEIPDIKAWREAFQKAGINPDENMPSHNALFERILNRLELPNLNSLVSITNGISLKYTTPFGAHDLDNIKGDVTVGRNDSGLPYTKMNTNEKIKVSSNEVVYADSEEILTRCWIWRQGNRSKLTEQTKNLFIPIDILGKSEKEIEEIAQDAASTIKHFLGECEMTYGLVDKNNQSIDFGQLAPFTANKTVNIQTHEILRDGKIINRILDKAVEEIIPSKEALRELLMSGRRLKLYQGFDATAPSLHIGHTVMMRKLEDFRKLGHEVVMLIGDFTSRIGDPTDKTSARQTLTTEQVNENLKLYREQAKTVLDIDNSDNPVKVVFNNDWLGKMTFADVVELASEFTVQQMLKRDMFQKRLKEDKPIYIHEFMYPLMQGWDSVAMQVDIELGGNDQLFNMLAGRQLVANHLNKEKFVIAGKLLTNDDGKKMSKTETGAISLVDSANDVYGKVMALSDELIVPGFELLTNANMNEVEEYKNMLNSGTNPMQLKKELALKLTVELKGQEAAQNAAKYFEEVFQRGSFEVGFPEVETDAGELQLLDLITNVAGLAQSKSQARRLVEQGAVYIDQQKALNWAAMIQIRDGTVIKAGRQVIKIRKID